MWAGSDLLARARLATDLACVAMAAAAIGSVFFFGTHIHVNFIKKKQECRRNGVHDATMGEPIAQDTKNTERVV